MKRTGKHPSECSSDVQHVHLTAADHHSDQGVVISSCTLHRGNFTHSINFRPNIAAEKKIALHLHCVVQGLSKISWNAPGTLHFKMEKSQHFKSRYKVVLKV